MPEPWCCSTAVVTCSPLRSSGQILHERVYLRGRERAAEGARHDVLVRRHDVGARIDDRLLHVGVERLARLLRVRGEAVEVRPDLRRRARRLEGVAVAAALRLEERRAARTAAAAAA